MTVSALHGLPRFLQYLSTVPSPDAALTALILGPLQSLGAVAGMVWQVWDGQLVRIGGYGHNRLELDRYSRLPLDVDFVVSRAVRDRTRIVSNDPAPGADAAASLDAEFWDHMLGRLGAVAVVRSPIQYRAVPIGAIGLLLERHVPDDPVSAGLLDATTSGLALWLAHPQHRGFRPHGSSRAALVLTDRQATILTLVEQGLTNSSIGRRLRLSDSTVKQDLQRAMRMLQANDRATAAQRARALGLLAD